MMIKLLLCFVLFLSVVQSQTTDCKNDWPNLARYYNDNKKLSLPDYFSAMVDEKGFLKDELSNDGLHPNAQGYAVMVPLAEAAVAASLKRSK